jgi:hypothetical protein
VVPVLLAGVWGCSGGDLLKIPFLSLTVQVLDEQDHPVSGAIVEVTNGQQFTTGADGMAQLKFGALGVHQVMVMAQDRVPASFTVSMPLDRGKTVTTRVGAPVEVGVPVRLSGGGGGLGIGGLMMGQLYRMLFQSLFVAQGYSMEMEPYEPGQWTEWEMRSGADDDQPMRLRKGFLARDEQGREWWQVHLLGDQAEDNVLLEVSFVRGRESIRRMRQSTGGEPAQEVPVSEGWYARPMELTPESLEGAVKQRGAAVVVPAGSFTADLLEFAQMGFSGGGSLKTWRVRGVPGGVVRADLGEAGQGSERSSRLTAHGEGAVTELRSY